MQALVDNGVAGTTITNTASVSTVSQVDPNSLNDTASVNSVPIGVPILTISKTADVLLDPVNGTNNPKAIPGATVNHTVETTNTGSGGADTDTFSVIDVVPANTFLFVADYDASTAGPVQFTDGATPSGLTYTFTALDDPGDDINFSKSRSPMSMALIRK